ncbi:hypothetical protein CEXT_75261 [Caerostris extrusa]|uniref:Uncharacterized protein n=1 Tax=Caerostris extrusa TaxID=172846 RepID=A0AAV4Q069_CAEEX|nr:hypothetical protein CEXT_75261 [Caerostris extrusa]
MTRFCTYAITDRVSNPLIGSTAVAVFKHDEIMHLCNCYLRFESTYGLNYCRCFQKCRVFASMQLLSEIRIHLWAPLQSVLKHDEILHVCNTDRDSNHL